MFRESLKSHMQGFALAIGTASLALGVTTPAQAEGVLDGETIRILGIGDPVFQVMQRIHGELE